MARLICCKMGKKVQEKKIKLLSTEKRPISTASAGSFRAPITI